MTEAGTLERPSAAPSHSLLTELLLRLSGAVLQVVATWAVVRALDPEAAGVYFRGFVIASGVAALLRAKYELYMAHHLIRRQVATTSVSDGVLLQQLGRRVLIRSSLACGALLVVMADIDIQAPRYQPALETYLPFVLSVPPMALSRFVGEALRAANRTLSGTVITSFALNLSILAVALVPTSASLTPYVWTFFAGSIASAVVSGALALRVFPAPWKDGAQPLPPQVLRAADEREIIALGRAALLWGPLTVLAVFSNALQMAEYAVTARTAMVADFLLPALNLTGSRDHLASTALPSRDLLVAQFRRALFISSVVVAALLAAAPWTLQHFGFPYSTQLLVYAVLLGEQWVNGVGRPAVRYAVMSWDTPRIRSAVVSGALAALFLCFSAIAFYGALAVALATFAGAFVLNGWAIASALRVSGRQGQVEL